MNQHKPILTWLTALWARFLDHQHGFRLGPDPGYTSVLDAEPTIKGLLGGFQTTIL